MRHQHTIARSCQVRGRGYWTGQDVTVTIRPAEVDSGIVLVRDDLPDRPQCPASVHYLSEAAMRTNLVRGQARFEMVEHLLSALSGLQIDNAVVEITAMELPGLDGSALAFVEALSTCGLVLQSKRRPVLEIDQSYRIGNGRGWVQVDPIDAAQGDRTHDPVRYTYQLSYDDDTPIAPQVFTATGRPSTYIRSIAPARTFITAAQADAIRASGMAGHVSDTDLIVIDVNGAARGNQLRFDNEFARHKTLDMIGDLSLCGVDVRGRFTSFRGGHVLNGRMARQLSLLASAGSNRYKQTTRSAITEPPSKSSNLKSSDSVSVPFPTPPVRRAA